MFMKYIVIVLATLSVSSTAFAQTMPPHVRSSLNRLIGTWTIETRIDDRVVIENATMDWTAGQSALVYQGKGQSFETGNPVSFSGILGWDASTQTVKEQGFDTRGGMFWAVHTISKDSWTDKATSVDIAEGKSTATQIQRTFTFQSADQWTIDNQRAPKDGKPQSAYKSIFRRSDGGQAQDLAAVQGRWYRKNAMKEIKGNVSVLYRYDENGEVVHSHRTVFQLSRRDGIKIYTGIQSEVLVGKNRGQKRNRPFSFIYRVNEKEWAETHGFMEGNKGSATAFGWSRTKPQSK